MGHAYCSSMSEHGYRAQYLFENFSELHMDFF
jgi:hypothetical protein